MCHVNKRYNLFQHFFSSSVSKCFWSDVFPNLNCFPLKTRNAFIISLYRTWKRIVFFLSLSQKYIICCRYYSIQIYINSVLKKKKCARMILALMYSSSMHKSFNWLYKVAIISSFLLISREEVSKKSLLCGFEWKSVIANIVKAKMIKETQEEKNR